MQPLLKKATDIIATKGWSHFELKDMADADTSLADVHAVFPSRLCVLEALGNYIDKTTLATMDTFDDSESKKDRLFSILMTRFDAIATLKPTIKSLWQDVWKDPLILACSLPMGLNSMSWLLQAANIDTTGIQGALRIKTFSVCYLATVHTWLDDESDECDQTMAALDSNLQRLAYFPQFFQQD